MDRVETIKSWYKDWQDTVLPIYSIFEDAFGEDRVDLQNVEEEPAYLLEIESTLMTDLWEILEREDRPKIDNNALYDTERNPKTVSTISDEEFERNRDRIKDAIMRGWVADILIYYPEVTVTNENGQSHEIKDLFVKVPVNGYGHLVSGISLNRATYTLDEFNANYLHSHISAIPVDDFEEFQTPCLGSGPIRYTISDLMLGNYSDRWMILAVQIDKLVHVESLQGGPYHRLERIGKLDNRFDKQIWNMLHKPVKVSHPSDNYIFEAIPMAEFVYSLCDMFSDLGLKVIVNDGVYEWGNNLHDTMRIISDYFISWLNEEISQKKIDISKKDLLENNILIQCKMMASDKIDAYTLGAKQDYDAQSVQEYQDQPVCTFKGKQFLSKILVEEEVSELPIVPNSLLLLNIRIVESIVISILYVLNTIYATTHEKTRSQREYYQV